MKLQIDNLDGNGLIDYTSALDPTTPPQLTRKLNQPSALKLSLVANTPSFLVPADNGRITLTKANAQILFTGYLSKPIAYEYLGWGISGPAYRYTVTAQSDEILLDQKRLPTVAPLINRTAASALIQLTQDISPNTFTTTGVESTDSIITYAPNPQETWSKQAGQIAAEARASYQLQNAALTLAPVAAATLAIDESDPLISTEALTLTPVAAIVNDLTVIGDLEPQAYVTDYFVGDGLTRKFYLSQTPFNKASVVVFDEEYTEPQLDPHRWLVTDPSSAISLTNAGLQVAGGTGADGATTVQFVEQIELGGSVVIQHGDFVFTAASTGVLGGLYPSTILATACLAGFQISPNGTQCNIQALINGAATGAVLATVATHHYVLTTLIYTQEIFRREQIFHSSLHPAGNGCGGATIPANVRLVLQVHDIDPANPATQTAPATVLYDGVIAAAPGFCTYAPIDAANLHCVVEFTRLVQQIDTEVRSALPGQDYTTLLVGTLSDGAECKTTSTELEFYSSYTPAANQTIQVFYRGSGRALARITNPTSIAAQQRGANNGIYAAVRHIELPPARTATDCENAALAILDDATNPAWKGEYTTWSDYLPGNATDIFPGDGINVNFPSRAAAFSAIVREVEITFQDLQGEHSQYKIAFANDAAELFAIAFQAAFVALPADPLLQTNTQVGQTYLADLTSAQVTQIASTAITLNAGQAPPNGGGIEVRWSDFGWGPGNNRNLLGRFQSQTFTLPRLAQVQNFYLQQYDNSSPPRYSRYSAALHVDYPL